MARGLSLHIGLNSLDAGYYQGWDGKLIACEADARDMDLIARANGFESSVLLTQNATRKSVIQSMESIAERLGSGDFLFLTYSGHGGQLPDLNSDEADAADETWCLFDGQLVDDELYALLSRLKKGVRVCVLSDSCHSGTMTKQKLILATIEGIYLDNNRRFRAMPDEIAHRAYFQNKAFYDPILQDKKIAKSKGAVEASVILISGCQDNQLSSDGPFNGLFTATLKATWNGGKFGGNYAALHRAICLKMPPDQTPNLFHVGSIDLAYEAQKPFTV